MLSSACLVASWNRPYSLSELTASSLPLVNGSHTNYLVVALYCRGGYRISNHADRIFDRWPVGMANWNVQV